MHELTLRCRHDLSCICCVCFFLCIWDSSSYQKNAICGIKQEFSLVSILRLYFNSCIILRTSYDTLHIGFIKPRSAWLHQLKQ